MGFGEPGRRVGPVRPALAGRAVVGGPTVAGGTEVVERRDVDVSGHYSTVRHRRTVPAKEPWGFGTAHSRKGKADSFRWCAAICADLCCFHWPSRIFFGAVSLCASRCRGLVSPAPVCSGAERGGSHRPPSGAPGRARAPTCPRLVKRGGGGAATTARRRGVRGGRGPRSRGRGAVSSPSCDWCSGPVPGGAGPVRGRAARLFGKWPPDKHCSADVRRSVRRPETAPVRRRAHSARVEYTGDCGVRGIPSPVKNAASRIP